MLQGMTVVLEKKNVHLLTLTRSRIEEGVFYS